MRSSSRMCSQPESCDFTYDPEQIHSLGYVAATSSSGVYLRMEPGFIYALKILGNQYWWNEYTGGADLYGVQISDDDGQTWTTLEDYDGNLCYSYDGDDLTVYMNSTSGKLYKLRVDSSSFGDNVGGMGYEIYRASEGDNLDPWVACYDGLIFYPVNSFEWIPVKEEGGTRITPLKGGYQYKLEILNGPWTDGEGGSSYSAAISNDNGQTWQESATTIP